MAATVSPADPSSKLGIPRNIWAVGWVSFFMDVSSEMVYPLIPLFLVNTLEASKSMVGLIEGVAEATASVLKMVSGLAADRFGKNRLLMGLGYGLSTASRPLLALASAPGTVLAARWTDRVGKGIRTAPRDAIISASTTPDRLGVAFGFHRMMDTCGAVIGPAAALVLLGIWPDDYRLVFWCSVVPGLVAVALIVTAVRGDGRSSDRQLRASRSLGRLNSSCRRFLIVIALFSLGNSGLAFLILRAESVAMPAPWISGSYLALNILYAAMSVPAGALADRIGRSAIVLVGFILFAAINTGLAFTSQAWHAALLFGMYGVYLGLTDGVQRAYLATMLPRERTATGFGLYHMIVGLAILPASVVAGRLWDVRGPAAPFLLGATLSLLAAVLFVAFGLASRGSAQAGSHDDTPAS